MIRRKPASPRTPVRRPAPKRMNPVTKALDAYLGVTNRAANAITNAVNKSGVKLPAIKRPSRPTRRGR
jgi:hypothetical protein